MDEVTRYNTYKHRQTEISWCIINIVLTLAYILEVIKQNRTIEYTVIFIAVTWTPCLVFMYLKNIKKVNDTILEYSAGIGYLFFYIFTMLSGQSKAVFCYIFPMLCVLTVYSNQLLNIIVMVSSLIINIISIGISVLVKNEVSAQDITFYEIQIACMVLCLIFLWRSSSVLLLRDNMIFSLSHDAYYDVLTKINNRAYLDKLEEQYKETDSYIKSIAIIDIDNFKQINDVYGHKIGDKVLINLANSMNYATNNSKETIPIRLGGDEFIIISSILDSEELYTVCDQVTKNIKQHKVTTKDGKFVDFTISIGVTNGLKGLTFKDLYHTVDCALYKAKESGKNQIFIV